ncbi:CotH kinase family protein [Parabacteroides sp. PF5-6]|uniref:CotH kinase family protein n=1 Tax=Parabacteroides sp. PF5-6 TaxID=1742403 RepID=UPI002405F4C3|nr:CotH kinase family protein [Parabacteroides sp. PF5-6]MDF9829308.1 hypothetical protein [Parabacteroides sp. PF5-6]
MIPKCKFVRAAGLALLCLFTHSGFSYAIEDPMYPFHPKTALSVTSSNLPLVLITLDERMADKSDDKRVSASMKIIWDKDGERNQVSDTEHYDYDGKIGIKYRGNSSYWNSDKKPFAVRIQDEDGKKKKASILGMGEDEDWALLAPYTDKSMIRDVLLFDLMRGSFEYVPTGRYCEVFLNGIYQGVYIMTARVRQGANRINIKKPTADSGDGLTGGYHLEIDRDDDPGFWGVVRPMDAWGVHAAKGACYYQMKYPDWEDLTDAQKRYIKERVWGMERSIAGEDFKNPKTGYRAYLDTLSLADFYIAQELAKNIDGYRLSTPFYKDKDSVDPRFKFSIWDFNISMGNADYYDGWSTEGWVWNNTRFGDDVNQIPAMFKRILEDETFREGLKKRWNDHRETRLSNEEVKQKADSLITLLGEAQERNFKAWPRFGQWVWPNYYVASSWDNEIAYLKSWLTKRIDWIDSQWAVEKVENLVPNGRFESAGDRGNSSEIKLSEWSQSSGNAYIVNDEVASGDYAMTLYPQTSAFQVISELTPGTYKLSAKVKTTNEPNAYMYIRTTRGSEIQTEYRRDIQADADFYQIIYDDLPIDNKAIEIGFVTGASTNARLWIDDVVLTRKDFSVSNTPLAEQKGEADIRVDRNQLFLIVDVAEDQRGESLEIFEITGRKLFARKITERQTIVGNIFQENMIYIVRIGSKAQKVMF